MKIWIRIRQLAVGLPLVILLSFVLMGFSSEGVAERQGGSSAGSGLRAWLMKRLVKGDVVPDDPSMPAPEPRSVIYVLGGNQKSLESRFGAAAYLCHHQIAKKVLLLSRPGITEYDARIGTNLTNDEWAIRTLALLGVKGDEVEPVVFEAGPFGTLSEAKGISALAYERGYTRLAVVSSAYHTMRVWLAFSRCLQNRGITLLVYGSDDPVGVSTLVREYAKLILYKYVVLPRASTR